jgi:glycosyltransferase involved in cell wall biosynthesis
MKKPDVKVSAMILTYNHERFIGQAIEGFLIQKTDFPCELVVIDDCSTDGTRDVIRRYWEQWPDRIRVILNRHNIGARPSTVRAYAACRGQYVASTDGDDYWVCPDKLQRQADFLDSHPACAMCFHSVTAVWDDGRREPVVMRPPRVKEIYTLADLLECNLLQACSPMYRKGLFDRHPVWLYVTPVMDWAHHVLHAQYGDIGYFDEPMGVYRQHRGGAYSDLCVADKLRIAIECLRRFRCVCDGRYRPVIADSLSLHLLAMAHARLAEGDIPAAKACVKRSIIESVAGGRWLGLGLLRALVRSYAPWMYGFARKLRRRSVSPGVRIPQGVPACEKGPIDVAGRNIGGGQ